MWLSQMGKKGTVVKQDGIRSYLIKTDDGGMYRRNRRHLNILSELTESNEEKISLETVSPMQSSPVTVIPIPDTTIRRNNQTRSGHVVQYKCLLMTLSCTE